MAMRHLVPAIAGQTVRLDGWVLRLHDGATPQVELIVMARGAVDVLAEIELRFAIVERHRFLRRLARPRPAVEQLTREARPA